MVQGTATSATVALNKSWIYAAAALLLLQTGVLSFIGFHVVQNITACRQPQEASTETPLASSYAAAAANRGDDKCFMGGIIPLHRVPAWREKRTPAVTHAYGAERSFYPPYFVPFSEILCSSTSDKQIHRFGHMYSEYLDPLRLQQEEVNLLEIGLRYGDSLNLWLRSFSKGKVYGLDPFYSDVTKMSDKSQLGRRIKIFKGDQENVTDLQTVFKEVHEEVGYLDIIVDDGGHTMAQQKASFTHLFPLLKPGGLYFLEDLQTSYWVKKCHAYLNGKPYCYGGGEVGANHTTIHLIKSLIDVLNSDWMEDHPNMGVPGSGVFHVNPVDNLVGSVQCWRNMCVMRRKYEDSYF